MVPISQLSRVVVPAFLLFTLAGCSDTSGVQTINLSIYLKDEPGPIKAAVVTISEIYLQGQRGKLILTNQPITTDLLTLANDTKTLVQDVTVPVGIYAELRFVITGGYIEVQDVASCDPNQSTCSTSIYASSGYPTPDPALGELQMPSFSESGLKVTLPSDALTLTTEQKGLLVDFDVAQSFGQDAGSGQWTMHPVLTGTAVVE